MNLLLDQNISYRVIAHLKSTFPEIRQVKELGLTNAPDLKIWQYAFKENYTIITFDSDFIDLANLKGSPPKVIWLRFGNASNLKIAHKLISNSEVIKIFIESKNEVDFLEID